MNNCIDNLIPKKTLPSALEIKYRVHELNIRKRNRAHNKAKHSDNPLPLLKSSDKLIFHPVEKTSVLYKYFAQVSTITDEPDIPLHGPGPLPRNNDILWEILFTEDEVYDQLSITDKSKPPGPDGVERNNYINKKNPLTKLFNMLLGEKKLPDI